MCSLCKLWESGRITPKEAYNQIGKLIEKSKDSADLKHLTELSDIILDELLPLSESDPEAENAWWKATHKHGDDSEG